MNVEIPSAVCNKHLFKFEKITWLKNSCKQTKVTASAVEKVSEEFWRTFSL